MTRKKVKLAYITNDAARKVTFNKRKKGLMTKLSELSILCGIEACAIIYSPCNSQPEVWPSHSGVQRVLAAFQRMPEMEQCRKMMNHGDFLMQRIMKSKDHLGKQRKDNREKEVTHIMFQSLIGKPLDHLNLIDLNDIGWVIDQRLKGIQERIDALKNNDGEHLHIRAAQGAGGGGGGAASPSSTVAAGGEHMHMHVQAPEHQQEQTADHQQRSAFEDNMESMQREPWFMDLMNPQPQDRAGFGGDEMIQHFGSPGHNALWSN